MGCPHLSNSRDRTPPETSKVPGAFPVCSPKLSEVREAFRSAERAVTGLLRSVAPCCDEAFEGTPEAEESDAVIRDTKRYVTEALENLRHLERVLGLREDFAAALTRIEESVSSGISETKPELRRFRMIEESLELLRNHLDMDYAGIWLFKDGDRIPLHEVGRLHPKADPAVIYEQVDRAIETTRDGGFDFVDPSDSALGGVDAVLVFRNLEGEPLGYLLLDDHDTAHGLGKETVAQISETYYERLHTIVREEESALMKKELAEIRQELDRMRLELENTRHDKLTGLLRKEFAAEIFERRLERIRRSASGTAVGAFCVFDIDHFKKVNDLRGHLVGDEVLSRIGNVFQNGYRSGNLSYHPRKTDTACRWGGEEFAVFLDETDGLGAKIFAERISSIVRELSFTDKKGNEFRVTTTVGVVVVQTEDVRALPVGTNALDHFFDLADRALYRGKGSGRNRVVLHDEKASETPTG